MGTDINSSKSSLPVKHIATAVEETIDYINKRRKGELTSLKTSLPKFNNALLNGVE
jgi:hypothetical protein